jgi:pimeloyl-ACP methyl ester carboxylesterase
MRDRIDLTQVLVQTELPIYFGIGAKDALIPQELMLSQAASCEKAYLTIFNDSAHMAMQEEPHTLAEDILKYLKTFDLI